MSTGLSTTGLANKWLGMLGGTAFTAPAATYAKLHTGDPGAAGTANASGETTRKLITWAAPSGGTIAISGTLTWSAWPAGSEVITHISVHDNLTAGTFLLSIQVAVPRSVVNGGSLSLTGLTASMAPLAA